MEESIRHHQESFEVQLLVQNTLRSKRADGLFLENPGKLSTSLSPNSTWRHTLIAFLTTLTFSTTAAFRKAEVSSEGSPMVPFHLSWLLKKPDFKVDLFCRFCGNRIPPDITTSDYVMTIVFQTDSSLSFDGFSATYNVLNASSGRSTIDL